MRFYVRKKGTNAYFIGYSGELQPLIGPAVCAFPFRSEDDAFASLPIFLHEEMEIVQELEKDRPLILPLVWPVFIPQAAEPVGFF